MTMTSRLAGLAACAALTAAMIPTAGVLAADGTQAPARKAPAKNAKARAKPAAAAAVEVPPPPASEDQLRAAEQVQYGELACEFHQKVDVKMNSQAPGYVDVAFGKQAWLMKPVLSPTGAVRLEDHKGTALLVQIADKSMILNTRSGQRLVDDCQSAEQVRYRELRKTQPADAGLGISSDATGSASPR